MLFVLRTVRNHAIKVALSRGISYGLATRWLLHAELVFEILRLLVHLGARSTRLKRSAFYVTPLVKHVVVSVFEGSARHDV